MRVKIPLTPKQEEARRLYISEQRAKKRAAKIANRSDEEREQARTAVRESSAAHFRKNRERRLEYQRAYRARNREKTRVWKNRGRALARLRKEPCLKSGPLAASAMESKNQMMQQNKAFAAASLHVPRHLPQDMRDDLVSDIVVACLEGKIRVDEVKKNVQRFITAHNRAAGYNVSLDAEIGDGVRMIDIITEDNLPW